MLRRTAVRLQQIVTNTSGCADVALAERLLSSSRAGPVPAFVVEAFCRKVFSPQFARAYSKLLAGNNAASKPALDALSKSKAFGFAFTRHPMALVSRRAFSSGGEGKQKSKFLNYFPKGLGGRQQPNKDRGQGENGEQQGFNMGGANPLLGMALLAFVVWSMIPSAPTATEISFQEFKNKFLASGLVAKLEVVNGDMVRVYQKSEDQPQQPFKFFFRIGSVDSFERRLDEAQKEYGLKSSDFIPVRYADAHMDWPPVSPSGRAPLTNSFVFAVFWPFASCLETLLGIALAI